MKVKILEKNSEPLSYREEVKIEIEFDAEVPSRKFLIEQISKALKASKDLVIIEKIKSHFGKKSADVLVHVYSDAKKLAIYVPKHIKTKHAEKKAEE